MMNIEVFGKANEKLNIEIHDYTGKNALKNIVIEKSSNSTEKASIDVSKLPLGLYFIKVFSDTEVNVKSVTIIK
jgi:hypothetical protein